MRILVFSDTHGNTSRCVKVIETIQKVDMIIHAGDMLRDALDLVRLYPKIPIHYVLGNNDFSKKVPLDKLVCANDKKIFVTHGHHYAVKYDYDYLTLTNKGIDLNADLVIFGHTHESFLDYRGSMTLLNPGSIKYDGTYGVVEIENDKLRCAICEIDSFF